MDPDINKVIRVIGRSKDRLKFFKIVYYGQRRIKTQEHILKKGNFINKRILDIGRKFIVENIIIAVKDDNKKIAYKKNPFYSQYKDEIISHVNRQMNNTQDNKKRNPKKRAKKLDIFICHASENKNIVEPFANKLRENDVLVWYDKFALKWGDGLVKKINEGLKSSYFGLVVLSKEFLKKQWPNTELEALIVLSNSDDMKILPLFYKISHKKITKKYPLLGGIVGKTWKNNDDELIKNIKEMVKEKRKK